VIKTKSGASTEFDSLALDEKSPLHIPADSISPVKLRPVTTPKAGDRVQQGKKPVTHISEMDIFKRFKPAKNKVTGL
jgi:hypothetical protein